MIKELLKLSNHLDAKGLRKEADYLDSVIRKMADEGHEGGDQPHLHQRTISEREGGNVRIFRRQDIVKIKEIVMRMEALGRRYATNWDQYDLEKGPEAHEAWKKAVATGNVKDDTGTPIGDDYWAYVTWYHEENDSEGKGWTEENNWKVEGDWLSPSEVVLRLNAITTPTVPPKTPQPVQHPPGDLRGRERQRREQGFME